MHATTMAIRCPGCGREYDVTLFQFGRTIHCTCGSRVGLDPALAAPSWEGPPRFAIDAMLGRLARWLRILGYDTAYSADIDDGDLVRKAVQEGRFVLTRDRSLPREWRIEGCLVLASDDPREQLREIARRFDLKPGRGLFTRCSVCNESLEDIDRDAAEGRVPARVLEWRDRFARCPRCGRIYWEGSHTERMRARLEDLLGSPR